LILEKFYLSSSLSNF